MTCAEDNVVVRQQRSMGHCRGQHAGRVLDKWPGTVYRQCGLGRHGSHTVCNSARNSALSSGVTAEDEAGDNTGDSTVAGWQFVGDIPSR